jgi:hypothetical protein
VTELLNWMWILLVIVGFVGLYLVIVAHDAKRATENAPREAMCTCDKHGIYPRKYTRKLMGMTAEPIEMCPFCLEEKFKEAKHVK